MTVVLRNPLARLPDKANLPASAHDDVLVFAIAEVAVYIGCAIICAILYNSDGAVLVTMIAPLVITVTAGTANVLMVRRDRNMLLTPLFAFRLTMMVYLGFGGLYDTFAPEQMRHPSDYVIYSTTAAEAAKVYLVWLIGMTLTMSGAGVAMKAFTPPADTQVAHSARHESWRTLALVWVVTFALDASSNIYLNLGGAQFLPSSIYSVILAIEMTSLFLLGQVSERAAPAKAICFMAAAASVLIGLLLQSKSLIIVPVLLIVLGALSMRFSLKAALLGSAILIVIFVQVNPIVIYGRDRQMRDYGQLAGGSIGERFGYVSDYLHGDRTSSSEQGSVMDRLDYVMPASFVIAQFDRGVANDELAGSAYMLIPRLIWPGKPSTTSAGVKVNYLMGLESGNQVGVTVFADIYWNLGWAGLLLTFMMGAFFGATSMVSRSVVSAGDWLMMPFVLAVFRVALGADGNFASGIMIPALTALALYIGLRLVRVVLPGQYAAAR